MATLAAVAAGVRAWNSCALVVLLEVELPPRDVQQPLPAARRCMHCTDNPNTIECKRGHKHRHGRRRRRAHHADEGRAAAHDNEP